MRVLFAIAHLDKGGGQAIQSFQVFRELQDRVDGLMVCLANDRSRALSLFGQHVEIVGPLHFPTGILHLSRAIKARKSSFDVFQAFDPYYALLAAKLARTTPLVVRLGMDPIADLRSRYGWIGDMSMRSVSPWLYEGVHVVVNSRTIAERFDRFSPHYIPNAVDVNRFAPEPSSFEARQELGLPLDVPLVTHLGKVIPRKHLEDLFWLLDQIPNLHALLVGETSEPYYGDIYYNRLRRAYPDVLARVHAAGEVPAEKVPRYLETADIFLFPSRLEGMPNAVLEAMAASLPVVAFDSPAHRDILPSDAGLLYRNRSQLFLAVKTLLEDEQERMNMGRSGRRHVAEHHSLSAAAQAYQELYRDVSLAA